MKEKNKIKFAYEIKYLSDFSDDKVEINVGVMSVSSIYNAAKVIEDYYDDLFISVNLTYLDYSSRNMSLLKRIKEHFNLTNTVDL